MKPGLFFLKAYEYCVKLLPLEDVRLKNCQFVKFEIRSTSSLDYVQRTICPHNWYWGYWKSCIVGSTEGGISGIPNFGKEDIPKTYNGEGLTTYQSF